MRILKSPGCFLLTVLRRCFRFSSYFVFIGVSVSFRIAYSIVSHLYVRFGGLIASVREKRANVSAIVYL